MLLEPGLAQGRGGALSLSDTEGYITDVLFKDNTASMGGGAIYVRGGHSVIKVPSPHTTHVYSGLRMMRILLECPMILISESPLNFVRGR